MRPLFVVFEGLDGSGTSTQARLLVDFLQNSAGQRVRPTSEPSNGPVGQMIRTAMSGRMRFSSDPAAFDRQMAYLFAADRHDHLYNDTDGVLKLLSEHYFVVSTRYYFSSFAYHCDTDGDFELIRSLNASFPPPDLTIYLDISVQTSIDRLRERARLDKYENAAKLAVVRRNYERIFSEYPDCLLWLSGDDSIHSLHERIVEDVLRRSADAC